MPAPRTPNVWLLMEPRIPAIDTEDARQFGILRPMISNQDNPSMMPGQALATMTKMFTRDYHPGDYLLYAPADPIVPLLAGLALHAAGATSEQLQWMRWEERDRFGGGDPEDRAIRSRAGFYVPSIIDARSTMGVPPRRKGG